MKKSIILFLTFLGGTLISNAQFGIRGGVSFNNLAYSEEPSYEYSNISTPYFGIFSESEISETLGFRIEANYTIQGSQINVEGPIDYKLTYIEVPVLLQFKTNVGLNIHLGPSVGYLLDAKAIYSGGEESLDGLMKELNAGANIGLNYCTSFGLEMEARYQLGVMQINKEEDIAVKTKGLSIGLGYKFL